MNITVWINRIANKNIRPGRPYNWLMQKASYRSIATPKQRNFPEKPTEPLLKDIKRRKLKTKMVNPGKDPKSESAQPSPLNEPQQLQIGGSKTIKDYEPVSMSKQELRIKNTSFVWNDSFRQSYSGKPNESRFNVQPPKVSLLKLIASAEVKNEKTPGTDGIFHSKPSIANSINSQLTEATVSSKIETKDNLSSELPSNSGYFTFTKNAESQAGVRNTDGQGLVTILESELSKIWITYGDPK